MIRVRGHSDDVLSVDTDGAAGDEFDGNDRTVVILIGTVAGGLVVRATYAPDNREPKNGIGDGGTWQMAIELIDEDVPIPWRVRIEAEGYTPIVVVECPDDTPFRELKR